MGKISLGIELGSTRIKDVKGFGRFMEAYNSGLRIERAAVENI